MKHTKIFIDKRLSLLALILSVSLFACNQPKSNGIDLQSKVSLGSGHWSGTGVREGIFYGDSAKLDLGIPLDTDTTFFVKILYTKGGINANISVEVN